MKKIATLTGAALTVAIAGHALGQVAVDGRLSNAEAASYGAARWAQTNPTGFGDNAPPSGSCNEAAIGNPAAVTTGVEYRIPLTSIGNPAGAIKLVAFFTNGGYSAASNQFLPALPGPGAAPLGNTRAINLSTIAGEQSASVSASEGATPTVDGVLDASYGAAIALQSSRTSIGDDTDASASTSPGSELDGLYAVIRDGSLYIMLTGNIKSDFGSKLCLFIDSVAGGHNTLPQGTGYPNVDFDSLQNMQGDGIDNGLTFDGGFTADYFVTFGAGNDPVTFFPNFADLNGTGAYLGCQQAGSGVGTLGGCEGNNAVGLEIAVNNANTVGVEATCPPINGDPDRSAGSELDNLFAYIDGTTLHVFIGGNLQNSYNKLDLFFDVASGGQNTLRGDNVDIDYNGLNNMAGLTFDTDFSADYWIGITNGNDPVEMYSNAAVLRTDGPRTDLNFSRLDYGAYEGGLKSSNNPITYDGPNADNQNGFRGNIYTNFAPRTVGDSLLIDPLTPVGVPNLVKLSINNSNQGGVTGSDAQPTLSGAVRTGFELQLDLNELGWDGTSDIKIAGFINNPEHAYLSNQVIGSLPPGTSNLEGPAGVNFANIAGEQFINLTSCAADFNGDGFVDGFDYDDFVACFEGDPCPPGKTADFNSDGFPDGFDYDDFVASFEIGCF